MQDDLRRLLFTPKPDFPLIVGQTALLVIDMQYVDAHPDGWLGKRAQQQGIDLSDYFRRIRQIVPNIGRLQEACRAAGVEVIHIKITSFTKDCRDVSREHKVQQLCAPPGSKDAEILEELRPVGDEIVLTKTSGSAFTSSPIDQVLRNLGVDRLIACGVVTNGCVELTVRDAADRGYFAIVVSDACAALTQELHELGVKAMQYGLIKVKTTAEVLEMLGALKKPELHK